MASRETCPDCGGAGFRIVQMDGRAVAGRCECLREDRARKLLGLARIPGRYRECDLENFDEMTPELRKARRLAIEFFQAYPDVEGGLMFLGRPGSGKTHLAVAILKKLVEEKGAVGIFYDFRELLKTIQLSWDSVSQTSELEVLKPVVAVPLLVLDDLGSGRATGWVYETLFYILTTRYNERRTTIITSNLPDEPAGHVKTYETLEGVIGTTLRSRLAEMCRAISIWDCKDYRREVKSRTDLHPF